jgi:hypothetical protein
MKRNNLIGSVDVKIRHKAGRAALWLSCGARFEQMAGVFAICDAF